jgi:glycosyltransferase involved in cell wall biosynthesis
MKVTIVSDVLLEENNGINVATMNLVRSLKNKGHEVRILCADQTKKGQPGYHIVGIRNFGPFNNYVKKNGVVLSKPDNKVIKEAIEGADIVHIITPFTLGKNAVKIAKELNIPITAGFHIQAENVSNHFFIMKIKFANYLLYKSFYNKLYKHCQAIHYPTQFIRDFFEKIVGKTNGYVISNGVNDRFKQKETEKPEELKDKFIILFTGRFSREKAQDVLIKAVANSKYKERIQLIFAGVGALKEKFEKLSRKILPIQPMFKFFSRDELVNVINYSDLYVHPAEIEIEAIACLEAISCGVVPVISNSTKSATKAFALDERNLFTNRDYIDLARKIDYWLNNPTEKQKCSEKYLGYATKFNQESCMDDMEKMLIETIKNYKK